jgi:hypothetical protein
VLNADVTNEAHQMQIRSGVEGVMNKLSKVAATDLSLPENQSQVNSLFDPILNDENILYDMSWTYNTKRELKKAESLQKNHPELVQPQNLHPLYQAQESYRLGDPGLRPKSVQFSPYYDYNDRYQKELDKIKADVDLAFSSADLVITDIDGSRVKIGEIHNQQKIEQLKATKVHQMLTERLNSDANALRQMSLDYNYNKDYGFYSSESALDGITNEIGVYTGISKNLAEAISSGLYTGTEKVDAENQLKYYNNELSKLTGLQTKIEGGGDPTEYFTFPRFVKQYIESKAVQYSFKKEGELSAVPGYDTALKYLLDARLETWKTKLKGKADLTTVEVPFISAYNSLLENPGGINRSSSDLAAFGDMKINSDGTLSYNLAYSNKTPENTVIIKPATGSFTQTQMADLQAGQLISGLKKELSDLGITRNVQAYSTTGMGLQLGAATKDVAQAPDVILRNHATNKDYYGVKTGEKIQTVVDKYKGLLGKLGVDLTSATSLNEFQKKLNDPALKAAIDFGQNLQNLNFKGRFEFRPDQDTNLVLGQSGVTYMKGRLVVPSTELHQLIGDKTISKMLNEGLISREEVTKMTGSDGKTSQEQMFGVSTLIPINGTPEEINDRMLKNVGLYSGTGKEDYQLRSSSKQVVTQFTQTLNAASSLPKVDLVKQGNHYVPEGSYTNAYGDVFYKNPEAVNQVKGIAQQIANQTGQKVEEITQKIFDIIGGNPSPVKAMQGISNLSLQGQVPDTVAARNNNPLNIKDISIGGIKASGVDKQGHAIFLTPYEGLLAGYSKLNNVYTGQSSTYKPNDSLEEFSKKYAESPTDINNLISSIEKLGYTTTATTLVSQIPLKVLFEAIVMKEDGAYYKVLKSSGILDQFLQSVK